MSEQTRAYFKKSEKVYPIASEMFEIEKNRIKELFPNAVIEHVGCSAIPGALTLGDLDIQIRISQEEFEYVSRALAQIYHENHPELWTEQFALFHWKDHPVLPMSIVLTVKDAPQDEFSKLRDLLKNNQTLLEEYNQLKASYEGKDLKEYRKAKIAFFGGSNGGSDYTGSRLFK